MSRSKKPLVIKEEYNYIDSDSINEDLCCSICHDIFDTVRRIKRCKHLFCYACILQSLGQNKSCPICRTHCTENDLQQATTIQDDLDQLLVYCNYSDCDWKGTRKDFKSHIQIECRFVPVNCNEHEDHPDCKLILKRKDIDDHRKECPHKMMSCPLKCEKKFYELEALESHVSDECVNRPITCPLCNQPLLYHELQEHDFTCSKKRISCPHKNILGSFGGCFEEFERKDLFEHLRSSCKIEPFKEAFRGINMHMMTLERKIELLQRSYKEELDKLSTLRLHSEDISTTEKLKNILKYNPAIRSLHLVEFQPGTKWQYLTEVLQTNDTITAISLKDSVIEKVGAVLLAKSLKHNNFIHTLILSDNNIGDQGIAHLSKSLEINKTIKIIDLLGNNISDRGMEVLCKSLESNNLIEAIDLSYNNFRTKGIEFLSRVIGRPRCNIHDLNISNNDIGYKGIESLSKGLEFNESIIMLNLERTKVGNKGVEYLSKSLEKNYTLEKLILAYNHIDDRGAEFLSNALLANQYLHTLDLEDNDVSDFGIDIMVKSMNKSAFIAFSVSNNADFGNMMRTLYLRRNSITREGLRNSIKGVQFVRVVTERE